MDINLLLQPFLETLLQVLAPIVVALLAVWLKGVLAELKAKISVEHLNFLTALAHQFVVAAEQTSLTGEIKNIGAVKKALVLALLQSEADAHNIKIDVDTLSAIIEAAFVAEFGLSK
jgi:hypothetical protein